MGNGAIKQVGRFIVMGNLEKKIKKIASYCRSYRCKECKHYAKFLTCNTMHTICWNKNNWFENKY